MSINLNNTSQYLDEAGQFPATIILAKMDWTKSGSECVKIDFRTDDEREISASYTEKMYWKLKRVAQAAGIPDTDFEIFEPDMLTGKQVIISTVKTRKDDGKEFTNVGDVFACNTVPERKAQAALTRDDVPF